MSHLSKWDRGYYTFSSAVYSIVVYVFIVKLRNVLAMELGVEAASCHSILQCETSTMKLIMDCSSLAELKSYEQCSSRVYSIESVTRGMCYALHLKCKDLLQILVVGLTNILIKKKTTS